MLEYHADLAPDRLDVLDVLIQLHAVNHDTPALMGLQMIDAADESGLARSRGAADDNPLALAHVQIQ